MSFASPPNIGNYLVNLLLDPLQNVLPQVSSAEQAVNVTKPQPQTSYAEQTINVTKPKPQTSYAEQTIHVTDPNGSSDEDDKINEFVDSIFTRTSPLVGKSDSSDSSSNGAPTPSGGEGEGEGEGDDSSFGWPQIGQGLATLGGALLGAAPGAAEDIFKGMSKVAAAKKPAFQPFHYSTVPWTPTNFQTYASHARTMTSGRPAGREYLPKQRS